MIVLDLGKSLEIMAVVVDDVAIDPFIFSTCTSKILFQIQDILADSVSSQLTNERHYQLADQKENPKGGQLAPSSADCNASRVGSQCKSNGEAGRRAAVGAGLGGDGAAFDSLGLDNGVLEESGGVPEDEIDGAADVALAVELAGAAGVESVLVGVDDAAVEDGLVGFHAEGYGLAV
ncbi:hypothetical protein IEQ34_018566 [Dendrobium chrysotoxum]|uniref:Uncharacterized protein n=1 Tax=Dendrobium chrysotoxum TaxID=161865 RepID=A0AAV7G681_DENCH|nr:hypothetical protein IEQ34_018566 [Dendrobium chrysotoxum]